MRRGIIISPDLDVAQRLKRALEELGFATTCRIFDQYPAATEMTRLLRAQAPEIVFLNVDSIERAAEVARFIEQEVPGTQMVAISRTCDPQMLLDTMRIGIREFLSMPFTRQDLVDALSRVYQQLEKRPPKQKTTDQIFSFLPSKAGVGTSTIATNAANAFSKLPDQNVLLSDFDLNSGMLRFMLKLDNNYCITDAAQRSIDMDEGLWPDLVTHFGKLDVLHAGKLNPSVRIEGSQIRSLIEFMRRNYTSLFFDLSGNLERYSIEIMQESRKVFLVCTPEIPSLHLAREKYQYLKGLDLEDRVVVLLNRCQKRPMISPEQIENLLGLPVHMTFPNDYHGVNHALTHGTFVDTASELGRQYIKLARSMSDRKQPVAVEPKKKFIEFFSLSPGYRVADSKKAR